MKGVLLAATAILVLGGAAVIAHAAGERHGPRMMHLLKYDLNKDGKITRAEINQGLAAAFKAADKNGNGSLDEAELSAYLEARRAERRAERQAAGETTAKADKPRHERMRANALKRMDWNLDGAITLDEFSLHPRVLAMRLDRDGDGIITAEERDRAARWRNRGDAAPQQKAKE